MDIKFNFGGAFFCICRHFFKTYGVKIPGFSTYWDKNEKSDSDYPNDATKKYTLYDQYTASCNYTLGIDCSGLVHRSLKYSGNNYKADEKKLHNINATMFMNDYSYSIQDEDWVMEKGALKSKQKAITFCTW